MAPKMKAALFGALLAICFCAVSSRKNPPLPKADRIKLGLYFVYDQEFSTRAVFKEGDSLTDYLTVLTNAAGAYFRQLRNPQVLLTVVGSSKLKERELIAYGSEGSEKHLDAARTLRNLEGVFTWNDSLPEDTDVVFFVSGFKTKTSVSRMTGDWNGLAAPRTICYGNASVGIIHDDGATFNGAHLLALQVALLVGAKKDNGKYGECSFAEDFLASSITGGSSPFLSDCSRGAIWDFYWRIVSGSKDGKDVCWRDWPKARRNNTDLPADFLIKKNCGICELQGQKSEKFKCSGDKLQKRNGACKACCDSTEYGRECKVNMPDGTPCGGHGICIYGQCF